MGVVITNRLIFFLMEQEGFSPTPYDDLGHPAIGYGHRITPEDGDLSIITEEEARRLLIKDCQAAAATAGVDFKRMVGQGMGKLPQRHRSALIEMVFNMGSLRGWPKFIAAIARQDIQGAIRESKRYAIVNGEKVYMKRRHEAFVKTFLETPAKVTGVYLGVVTWPLWVCWAKERLIRRKSCNE